MRSPTAPAFDFLMMALAVVIVVVIPSTQAFLYPTRVGGAASTRRCPSHHLCQQRPVVSQRSCVSSKVALSMLSEENGAMTEVPDTEVNDLMEKAKAAQASIARPSLPVVIGPVMQPKEQKKKQEQDAAASSEPKNQWASGAFKRGLALQVPVPPEHNTPVVSGCNAISRPLVPPTVDPSLSPSTGEDSDVGDDDFLDEAVEDILRKVEGLRKSNAFPGLESFDAIDQKRDCYLGPTMESNWVLPGKLLVGAYPASMNDSHHAHLLCTILLQGVSTFVCLQQEYRTEGVTEAMWRSGEALRPYFQDVLQLLRKLRELKAADPRAVPAISAPDATDFVHFPIVDCNVADDMKVLQLAAKLAARVARGEILYLHCWGGHGRTGTVVSIMLHLMYSLNADEAMERCQHVHDVRRIPISVGSPQTEAQRDQVRRILCCLGRRSARAATNAAVRCAANWKQQQFSNSSGLSMLAPASGGENTLFRAGAGGSSAAGRQDVGGCLESSDAGASSVRQVAGGNQATAGAVVGGRRGWVRRRRQAFARAPNGVGEDVSGWLMSTCDEGTVSGAKGGSKSGAEGGEVGEGDLTRAGRRKSLEDGDASRGRGGRATRLRRKSAPGQSPRSAEVAVTCSNPTTNASENNEQYRTEEDKSNIVSCSRHDTRNTGKKQLGAGGERSTVEGVSGVVSDFSASAGSCIGIERGVTRSGKGRETGASEMEPGAARRGGRRLQ